MGSSAYSIAAKGLVKIRIQLSKTGRALLKSGKGHLKTTLTFAISPGTDTVSQSVTLKAAKKKH